METKSADMREGEVAAELPATYDAGLYFIGRIETPWKRREDCPRRGDPENGPECRIVLDPAWRAGLTGLDEKQEALVLYFMHQARRDLVIQNPRHRGLPLGTFALRSPVRPNPIAASRVRIVGFSDDGLVVRGLDCVDGTPLIDLKPEFDPGRKRCDE